MKTNFTDGYNALFRLAWKGLRYLLLSILGFTITYVLSTVFGAVFVVDFLLSPNLWQWVLRIFIALFSLFMIAIIFESFK